MLFTAKLTQPQCPAAMVDRPRLYGQLDRWREYRAVIIQAPAGYGKSSLVSRWIDRCGHGERTAWLALDEDDGDPHQFVRYFAAALESVAPGAQRLVRPILEDSQGNAPRAMTRLLTALEDGSLPQVSPAGQHLLLVLDDLHRVQSPEVNALIVMILERGPDDLHLFLLTRRRTGLPLARLYVREAILALTADDLRFTAGEVDDYLLAQGFPPPTESEVAQVAARSEGWVTALQLAVLSLHRRHSTPELIRALHGASGWLTEYLTDEVLNRQTPELRRFLLQTSILDTFNVQLCAAVTGEDDAYQRLSEIAHADLFLIALDNENEWFRYHHLFQELLQHRLKVQTEAETVAILHRRAATWLAHADHVRDAVRHLFAAGDVEDAAATVEKRVHDLIYQDPYRARSLFDLLPRTVFVQRPILLFDRCRLAMFTGSEEYSWYVQQAERTVASQHQPGPDASGFHAQLLVLRAYVHYRQGAYGEAIEAAVKAQASTDELDDFMVGTLHFLLMHLRYMEREVAAAQQCATRALRAFRCAGTVAGTVAVRREIAIWDMRRGHGREAENQFQALFNAQDHDHPMVVRELALAYYFAAENSYWQNHLEQARAYQQSLMVLARQLQDDEYIRYATWLAEVHAAVAPKKEVPKKEAWKGGVEVHDPVLLSDPFEIELMLHKYVDLRTRGLIASGRGDEAWAVVDGLDLDLALTPPDYPERTLIPYLRAYISRGVDLPAVTPMLAGALAHRVGVENRFDQLQLLALTAWQQLQLYGEKTAAKTLVDAANLVEETGYVRVLLDIPELARLLPKLGDAALPAQQSENFESSTPAGAIALTRQERRVLNLLATDRTYQQIAEELVISINTVRTHVRHIYKKLSVHRRDQAVAKAVAQRAAEASTRLSRTEAQT